MGRRHARAGRIQKVRGGSAAQAEVPFLRAAAFHVGENGTRSREDFPACRRDRRRISASFQDVGAQSDSRESAAGASAAGGAWQTAPLLLRDAAEVAAADDRDVLERR